MYIDASTTPGGSTVKHQLRALYDRLRFGFAGRFGGAFGWYYWHFHTPRPGSLGDLLSTFSRITAPPLTVVQVGANDGLKWDPLHKFIRRDRWQGVLLEPQPGVFREWLQPLHARNRRITTVNAALGPADGEMPLYQIGFSTARWATGLASFQREQLERVIESDHVRRQAAKEGVAIPTEPARRIREERVEVISTDTLFERYGLRRIDLLFVDTEGFDFEIVKLFDVAARQPRLVVYENAHLSPDDRTACVAMLESAGYRVADLGPNSFALARDVDPAPFARFFTAG